MGRLFKRIRRLLSSIRNLFKTSRGHRKSNLFIKYMFKDFNIMNYLRIPFRPYPFWFIRHRLKKVFLFYTAVGVIDIVITGRVNKFYQGPYELGLWASEWIRSYLLSPRRAYWEIRRGAEIPPIPDSIPKELIPKTLILTVRGTLGSRKFSMATGLRLKKRPGLDVFLRRMSKLYEIIIYIEESPFFMEDFMMSLDPNRQYISGKIGSECYSFFLGKLGHIDLSMTRRDIKNIIVVDSSPETFTINRANSIAIPSSDGSDNDMTLYELMPFLEDIANKKVEDVREVLNDPEEAMKWRSYFLNLAEKYNSIMMDYDIKENGDLPPEVVEFFETAPKSFFVHPDIGLREEDIDS